MKPKYPVTYKGLTIYDAKGRNVVSFPDRWSEKHVRDSCAILNHRRFKKVRVKFLNRLNDGGSFNEINIVEVDTIDWRKAVPFVVGTLIGNSIGIGIMFILGFL